MQGEECVGWREGVWGEGFRVGGLGGGIWGVGDVCVREKYRGTLLISNSPSLYDHHMALGICYCRVP